MKTFLKTAFLITLLTTTTPTIARADDYRPDDSVAFTLATEGWVSTKTARVVLSVEAAVTGNSAATLRTAMTKAVNDTVKAEWRLTSFNRSQDQTGLERWSALYEARVNEADLGGLHDQAKKTSKAGMQLTVSEIDFSPTLDETQATMAQLRTQIFKQTNEQLAALNTAIPGRNYRIGSIAFGNQAAPMMMVRSMAAKGAQQNMMTLAQDSMESAPMERAEKITLTAHVIYAATPTQAAK